jgi:hypothetical protein
MPAATPQHVLFVHGPCAEGAQAMAKGFDGHGHPDDSQAGGVDGRRSRSSSTSTRVFSE